MDREFERRWRAGEAPFNGFTLFPAAALPLPVLRRALRAVVAVLEASEPRGSICRLPDRHGRDGQLTEAVTTTWAAVRAELESDETLYAARPPEPGVSLGIFPASRKFYLRFSISDAADATGRPDRRGGFDVTGPKHLVEAVADGVATAGVEALAVEFAKHFFDMSQVQPPGDTP